MRKYKLIESEIQEFRATGAAEESANKMIYHAANMLAQAAARNKLNWSAIQKRLHLKGTPLQLDEADDTTISEITETRRHLRIKRLEMEEQDYPIPTVNKRRRKG